MLQSPAFAFIQFDCRDKTGTYETSGIPLVRHSLDRSSREGSKLPEGHLRGPGELSPKSASARHASMLCNLQDVGIEAIFCSGVYYCPAVWPV
jgi:hypothetical protein